MKKTVKEKSQRTAERKGKRQEDDGMDAGGRKKKKE